MCRLTIVPPEIKLSFVMGEQRTFGDIIERLLVLGTSVLDALT